MSFTKNTHLSKNATLFFIHQKYIWFIKIHSILLLDFFVQNMSNNFLKIGLENLNSASAALYTKNQTAYKIMARTTKS